MAAKRLFVFYVGGTGARVMKSLVMLLASGMKPGNFDEIVPIPLDPHKELEETKNIKSLIKLYSSLNERIYTQPEIKEGFFRTRITELHDPTSGKTSKDNIEFDEEHSEAFGSFIDKTGIRSMSPSTIDFLSLLYSETNFSQPLKVGFKGNPHMGSLVLNSVIDGEGYKAFEKMFNPDDSIFIISSLFGGTGAAGFPLLLQNFRQSDNSSIKECRIGSLSIMPYFKLSSAEQTSDIDSNDFMTKTKSALTYYSNPDFSAQYNSIYYIADPTGANEYKNDEKEQPNNAHLVELLGALSVFHFADPAKATDDRGKVFEYSLIENNKKIDFKTIANDSRNMFAQNLASLFLLNKIHTNTKKNHKKLSYCKTNDFDTTFFEDAFFTDEEFGLEKFYNKYFNPWLIELDNEKNSNQRSFSPFNLKTDDKLHHFIKSYPKENKNLKNILNTPIHVSDLLNKMSKQNVLPTVKSLNELNKFCQYLLMCYNSSNELLNSIFKLKDNGEQK